MKKVNREDSAGLQEWLSYQSRTRAAVQPASDVIDWDEGIEVQEEWLPREMCEQRLREEAERQVMPAARSVPNITPVVEVEDVSLCAEVPAARSIDTAADAVSATQLQTSANGNAAEPGVEAVVVESIAIEAITIEAIAVEPTAVEPLVIQATSIIEAAAPEAHFVREIAPREPSAREIAPREPKSKFPAPAQFETGDFASALPAFDR
jgi:hypothetical protein